MSDGSAEESGRRHFRGIRRLVCGAAAAVGLVAAISAVASAQNLESPIPNPTLEARCGLKVMLVLDESQSIHSFGAVNVVRSAANTFVTALEGTGSPVAVSAFHSFGRRGVPNIAGQPNLGYMEVTPQNISTFTNWIGGAGGGYNPPANASATNPAPGSTNTTSPSGTTNWEDAFDQVGRTPGGSPNLVVFVTDGDPNTVNAPGNSDAAPTSSGRRFISNNADGFAAAVRPAITAANNVKRDRARVFGIGVGPDVQGAASTARLRQVSGDIEGTNPIRADYTLVRHFDDLRAELLHIVSSLCGSSLTITKYVKNANGVGFSESAGWEFRTTLESRGHTWLEPAAAGTNNSATQRTDESGHARFAWRLHHEHTPATVGITKEAVKPGFRLVAAKCLVHHLNGEITTKFSPTEIPSGAVLGRQEYQACEAWNIGPQAHLEVIKDLRPANDPGRFNLLVDDIPRIENVGNGGTTGRLLLGLGRHTVSETAVSPTDLADYSTSIQCVDRSDPNHVVAENTGQTSLTVNLTSEAEDIVCTIANTSRTHGTLTIVKHLLPPTDPGRFDLLLDGNRTSATRVGDGGSTGPMRLPFGRYTVSEEAAAPLGLTLSLYTISTTCSQNGQVVASGVGTPEEPVPVTLDSTNNDVLCTITNERNPPSASRAFLSLRLSVVPNDDPGRFDLRIDGKTFAPAVGHGGNTNRLVVNPGTHEVSLSVAALERGLVSLNDYSISTRCRGIYHSETVNATGPEPVSTLVKNPGDKVDCEILLTRKAFPPEPGGGGEGEVIPEEPCPDCGDVAVEPRLLVSKQMPAHARVGDRVPVAITVENVGHATAHQVRVHETPSDANRIVAVRDHGSIQNDGTVLWALGSLAPGERRTVHATVLVTRPGLHLDTAVADAGNADPAVDEAALRAPGPGHPRRPAFTG